jgi:predicted nucleic acid-binding protein
VTMVIDVDLVVALILSLSYLVQATHTRSRWQLAVKELCAPALLAYEVVTALWKALGACMLSAEEAVAAITNIQALPIEVVAPSTSLNHSALRWAEHLGHTAAYDAHMTPNIWLWPRA